jgi:hypothetical protein
MADADVRLREVEDRLERLEIRVERLDRVQPAAPPPAEPPGIASGLADNWLRHNPVTTLLAGVVLVALLLSAVLS